MKQLTHLEHLEDLLMEHPDKVEQALIDMHLGIMPMTLKWDGAPAIVFGNHPETGKFFLGTKSVFNVTPKVNYSTADIMANHGDNESLASKLMYLFEVIRVEYAQAMEYRVFQADLLYTRSDLMIDRQEVAQFRPNTLCYKPVRKDTNEAVKNALVGLAIHTEYMRAAGSLKLNDMDARQIDAQPKFSDKIFQAQIEVEAPRQANGMFSGEVRAHMAKYDRNTAKDLIIDTGLWDLWKIFQNSQIKDDTISYEDDPADIIQLFKEWTIDRVSKKMAKKKTIAGAQTELKQLENLMTLFTNKKVIEHFHMVIMARSVVIRAKNAVLPRNNNYNGFYASANNNDQVGHEGIVATMKCGDLVKIVPRTRFSRINFQKNGNNFKKN